MMNKKKDLKLEITELFMAKAGKKGWDRCFYGTIKRLKDEKGIPYVFSKITLPDGFVCASASNDTELGEKLDELIKFHLNTKRKI